MTDSPEHPATASLSTDRLHALARAWRVDTTVTGFDGVTRDVPAATLVAVLAALGVTVRDDAEVDAALADRELAPWRRLLPPVLVVTEGEERAFPVHVPHGDDVLVWVETEDGRNLSVPQRDVWTEPREVDGRLTGRATFAVPAGLPLGWHTVGAKSGNQLGSCRLIVTPRRLATADTVGATRQWGLMTQLYSVRSRRSWGVGDLADLADLASISGAEGAGWLLINPLHAAEPAPPVEPSPYLPTSRRFFHPLYIRVEDIPEYAYLPGPERARVADLASACSAANTSVDAIDRDPVYTAKLEALALVHAVERGPWRQDAYARFVQREGAGLRDFALWCALRERHDPDAGDWVNPDLSDAQIGRLRSELADRIDFFCWLQFVADEQLAAAQRVAEGAGMGVGILHDLAVGVHRQGSDAWTLRHVLAPGVTVGAPADMYSALGQNWNQPPWHPERLAEAGYVPFRDMLRTILRHAGGIRVDHILGLFRLWWVPEGTVAADGAYVGYDHEAMIGVLALEAQRAGAVVIGEDLGLFEPWVRRYLADRGILGTSILWFEFDEAHDPLPVERYRRLCLASVNTHDLPPTAGYLSGEHIRLRERLGLLDAPLEQELAADRAEQEAFLVLARERGLLPEGADEEHTIAALYELLGASPACLIGVSLVDAVGEKRVQNQPGTKDEYPNWRVPLADADGAAVLVEDLAASRRARGLFATVARALR
ncbi:4-alpha-glucanotransferase [Tersicoccus solisilvae]|uniref:4-alpha-glucanotransferase n=1 Tax=Tersicoccus solisilvae TaxID=1882339 RepID=A0ABQ1NLQ0_9MICC|nr:4-alpha-glucanotransferase [Tersicoccus solisilvae]GGC80064.1 4-alpha-glucanotransferase [Tersicoccus solisilvae]